MTRATEDPTHKCRGGYAIYYGQPGRVRRWRTYEVCGRCGRHWQQPGRVRRWWWHPLAWLATIVLAVIVGLLGYWPVSLALANLIVYDVIR